MSKIYIVQQGESIVDVCENSCGALQVDEVNNLDEILQANDFDSWTPELAAGQQVLIPDSVKIDANALRQLVSYPICNNSVNDIDAQINAIFGLLNNNWILRTGLWNDNGIWIDTAFWIDNN